MLSAQAGRWGWKRVRSQCRRSEENPVEVCLESLVPLVYQRAHGPGSLQKYVPVKLSDKGDVLNNSIS